MAKPREGCVPTDTYTEQRPGTAVVVVGYFAHCLIIIHGHPANKTKQNEQAVKSKQCDCPGDTCQCAPLLLKKFPLWKN